MRPYADRMQELMVGTARAASSFRNLALLQRREVQRVAIVVVTGDRGLAGPFNGQVLRKALSRKRRAQSAEFLVYDQEGASCDTPGCRGTIRRVWQAGRSTFYCPVCQR